MVEWEKQLYFDEVQAGDEIPPISLPLTLQRMIMEAGANRDFSSIHHDTKVARATGAPDVYMNSFFIVGMFERLLREWIGLKGKIKKIGPFRMRIFNCVGDLVTFKGKVKQVQNEKGEIVLDIWSETRRGQTTTGEATVMLPKRE
jgi:acyl dehydratase